jgi:hypothetical protein
MSHKAWDGERFPSLGELRADLPEVQIHGKKKKTKRWCKGKIGVEHQPEVRLSKMHDYWVVLDKPDVGQCGWSPWYRWRRTTDGVIRNEVSRWSWRCYHERVCSKCGKILEWTLGRNCPDFAPRVSGD